MFCSFHACNFSLLFKKLGNHRAALDGANLLTASGDSKVNLWDISTGRLMWSNSRSEARFKASALNADRAIVVGSYDEEGYLQLYERATGDVIHEQVQSQILIAIYSLFYSGFLEKSYSFHAILCYHSM